RMTDDLALKQIENNSLALIDEARAIVVSDLETEQKAASLWEVANSICKEIDNTLDPRIKAAHGLHKSLVALKAETKEPLENVKTLLKRGCADFRLRLEQERQAKEKELEEAARKLEEERRIEEAVELESNGLKEQADALLAEPIETVSVVVAAPPKPKGIILRSNWTWKVEDENLVPREYLTLDTVKITKVVKAMKNQTKIPGIKVYEEKV
ncbi:MAG TPA: hypothetical protein PLA03_13385, partial [Acidobacteriota bacterium]|nr:hypothetical protein [Acidobacteriota bacterium]